MFNRARPIMQLVKMPTDRRDMALDVVSIAVDYSKAD